MTAALEAADTHRSDGRNYKACVDHAARIIDRSRASLELVDRKTDSAWRD